MKSHILILALFITTLSAFGQPGATVTPPASLPIASKAMLTAYANGRVHQGYISHSSNTMLVSGGDGSYLHEQNGDVMDLLKALGDRNASFKVANSDDDIYTWVVLLDKDWQTIYYGERSAPLQQVGGNWKLSSAGIKMTMSTQVLPFPGVISARLIIRDANGNVTEFRYLDVTDGKIYFNPELAGWGDEFIVEYYNGTSYTSAAYSVKNEGGLITPTNVTGKSVVSIENQSGVSDETLTSGATVMSSTSFVYNVQGTKGSPLIHLKLASNRQFYASSVALSEETPSKPPVKPTKYIFYRFQDGVPVDEFEVDAVNGAITVTVPAGTYEVTPDFGDLFESKELPPQYYYGGGKG